MKKASVFLCGLVLAASASTCALADTITFNFDQPSSSSQYQFSGSATLTVEEQSTGIYLVTGISGTVNEGTKIGSGKDDVAITSLLPTGSTGETKSGTDNLFYDPSSSNGYFSKNGLEFTLADGSTIYLYSKDAQFTESRADGGSQYSEHPTLTASADIPSAAAPEPSSLLMVGSGLLGLAGLMRRKLSA